MSVFSGLWVVWVKTGLGWCEKSGVSLRFLATRRIPMCRVGARVGSKWGNYVVSA